MVADNGWHILCFVVVEIFFIPKRPPMKKLIPFILLAAGLLLPVTLASVALPDTSQKATVECTGCDPERNQSEKKSEISELQGSDAKVKTNTNTIHCFNCNRRPCGATKEAWIRLWHKYRGVDIGSTSNSPPKKEGN